MRPDIYTFPTDIAGLAASIETTLSLRRAGYKTRLVERVFSRTNVITVVATPPRRPTRRERGASL